MAVINLYSKRRKAELKAGEADVFQYDTVSKALRAQVVHIWRDAFGSASATAQSFKLWKYIHDLAAREFGVMELVEFSWCVREVVSRNRF